jgi:membrane fusion protein, multidrug efflux system
MKISKRSIWIGLRILLTVLVVGSMAWFGFSVAGSSADKETETKGSVAPIAKPVKTAVVRSGCVSCVTFYPGMTRAVETAKLAFRVGGPVSQVLAKPGDMVRKGDVLMRIDPRDFQSQVNATAAALDAAKAKLAAMKKGARDGDVRALEANLSAAEAKSNFCKKQYARFATLIKQNAVSRSQYDATASESEAAQSAVDALKEQLAIAKKGSRIEDIQGMEAQIRGLSTQLKVAKDALDDTNLRAPFEGIVTKQLVEAHESVEDGNPVLAMHNIQRMEIAVHLPDKELVNRDLDAQFNATVCFHALGDKEFTAAFKEVDTEANLKTRTYEVTFVLDVPDGVNLLPGMSAEVALDSAQRSGEGETPMVPSTAVFSDSTGKEYVWVVDPSSSTAIKREIKKGRLSRDDCYEVIDGLAAGDRVVTAGASFLVSGMKLRSITR